MNRSFTVTTKSDLTSTTRRQPNTTSAKVTNNLLPQGQSFEGNPIEHNSIDNNTLLSNAVRKLLHNKTQSRKDSNRFNAMLHLSKISHLSKTILSTFLVVVLSAFQVMAADIDLRLTQSIDNSQPELGDPMTYTIWLVNDGNTDASNITLQSQLPLGAIGAVVTSPDFGTANYSSGTGIVDWTVPVLLANDSIKLEISTEAIARGVYFSVAEITSATETDIDSSPGNSSLVEDDIATACFSVPLFLYDGEEYTVTIPAPYNYGGSITWYKDGIAVTGATSGAVVNADSSLSISSIGDYTFTTDVNTCQASGCCAIQIIPGPYGTIGDYVWTDLNKDGLQQPSETPVGGMIIELTDGSGNVLQTTTTDSFGFYEFDSLTDGDYQVKFNLTGQNEFTTQNNPANDALDSDAGLDSLSQLVTISIFDIDGNTRDSSDINRFNPTIDAGVVPILDFDLALRKTLASTGPFYPGDPITYDIVVFNQGDINATAIKVVDYVPAGLTLSGSGWTMDGDTARYNSDLSLVSGDSTTVSITFTIDAGVTGNVRNSAEIADARDPLGDPVEDIDSTPDSDDSNDGTPSDDEINEDGKNGGDEDDSDFAEIIVGDLAELGNYVWEDTNADGVQDLTENGVAGVIVELLDENGFVVKRDTTDASGLYLFDELNPGDYSVRFLPSSLPSGFEFTSNNTGNDDTDDSDADENTGETIQTTLTAGESDLTWDAGIFRPASLGDYVWLDENQDGIQDPSEDGILGVMVVLEDGLGNPLDTTYTDANGAYSFDDLRPGDYVVSFETPTGLDSSPVNNTADTNDSDADPITGKSPVVTLVSGENNPTIDAGFFNADIFDLALRKTLASTGPFYPGDPVTYDIVVFNQGDINATAVKVVDYVPTGLTLSGSGWTMDGDTARYNSDLSIVSGDSTTVSITFIIDAGVTGNVRNSAEIADARDPLGDPVEDIDSTPDSDDSNDGTPSDDEINEDGKNGGDEDDSDFAEIIVGDLAELGNYVWEDTNADGVQDLTENGVAGVIVELLDENGLVIRRDTTDASGLYLFDELNPGDYSVRFLPSSLPSGFEFTSNNTGNDDTDDSDADENTGETIQTTLTAGESDLTWDAGIFRPASLGDYVWLDENKDGVQDITEAGIPGVMVVLQTPSGTPLDTTYTDVNGNYLFEDLRPGDYVVSFEQPDGFTSTSPNNTGDINDSDADPLTGESPIISLQSGDINPTIDAGFYPDEEFDLALRKTSTQTSVIAGGQITYNITVFNQGNLDATNINVMDNIPSGLTLSDANWEVAGSNVVLRDSIMFLAAGADTTVSITFDVSPSFLGTVNNFAEITDATGPNGEDVVDVDSTPDTDPGNDGTTVDDEIDEDGKNGGDEDDSDMATVTVTQQPVFDLALVKTLTTASPIYPGMMVTFDIEIINQGTVDATQVQIADYVPTGMTVADANWTQTGSIATYNNPLSVVAATTNKITITMEIAENAIAPLNNMAEITDAKGPIGEDVSDIDSNYDNDPSNEGPITDDEVNGDGKNGGDDDDSDIAEIPLSPLAALGDYVWLDVNQDGIQDLTEVGIENVVVTLESASGTVLESTTTDVNGYYSFTNLIPGSYRVRFTKPGTLIATSQNSGSDDAEDSDADITTGLSQVVTLTAGEFNRTIDAGFYSIACETIDSIIASNSSICVGDSSTLVATSTLGTTLNWYLTPTGGTPLFSTASGASEVVFPTTTTIYYVGLESINSNCPADRVSLALVVNARPSNPTCGNIIEICTGETTDLDTHIINGITTPGGVFEWHTGANPNSPIVANPQTAGAGTYYLFERSGAGCYSNPTLVEVISKSCVQEIDLSLLKIADRRNVEINDIINYTITVNNAGPDVATNVVVEDVLPAGLTFISSTNFTNTAGTLTATLASVAVGETVTLTYSASVQSVGTIINVAEVKAADQVDVDSTPGNSSSLNEDDDDDEVIIVTSPDELADLSLLKLVSDNTPQSNDLVNYTIRVTNSGPDAATNVQVADLVPAGLSYQSSAGGDNISVLGNTVTATFNTIAVGQTVEFTVLTRVTGTGTIINSAQVMTSDQNDPDSTPGSGTNEDDDGTASITVTDPCNPTTPLIACANPYICQGESTVITAVNCTGTIVWSNGATGSSVTVNPSISTIYTARCQVGSCLSNESNPVAVIVNQIAPPLVATSNATVCSGESVTLTSTGCSGTITWSTGATGSSIVVNPVATTSYTATCSVATCTSTSSNPVTVTVGGNTNPPTIASNVTQVCSGESAVLTAINCAGTVTWSTGATGNSITVNPTSSTSYTATCGIGTCISPNSNAVNIAVSSGQTPTITASNTNICAGSTVTLTASNCSSGLLWSTGETTNSINVAPTATTTYTATCGTGSCAASASQEIQVGAGSTPVITVSNTSICQGETITLTAANCQGTLNWSNGASGSSISVTPISTTTYTVTCSNGNGCDGTAQVTISVTPKPAAPVVTCGKERICAGESLTFTGHDCDGTVTWSTGAVGTSMIVNPSVTTQYSATCTVNGCESDPSIPVTITVLTQTPTITASQTSVCVGESATLTAGSCSGTIEWSTGETTANITVSPSVSTTYTVSCTVEGCIGTASQTIDIGGNGEVPTISASNLSICQGESVTLNVTNCSQQVNWSTGESGNSITVSPSETTSYTATCGSASCAGSSAVTIQVGSGNAPTISASQDTFCGSGTATITVAGCSGNISWNTGETGSSITVTPTVSTTYTATCGSASCSSSVSQTINITNSETPNITASNSNICAGSSTTLTANNCSGLINWNTGETGNSISVSPTSTTTYTATCGQGTTCEASASIEITVGTGDVPTIAANNDTFCGSGTATITVSGCNGNITWNTGQSGNSITVTPSTSTTYTATCTNGTCSSQISQTINITNSETPSITASNSNICAGSSSTLTASSCSGVVNWNTGETGNNISVSPASTTTYTATCGQGTACEASASVEITVGTGDVPTIATDNDTFCGSGTATITVSNCSGSVSWNTGQVGNQISVTPTVSTTYTATCTNGTCSSQISQTINITNGETPTISASNTSICASQAVTLTASGCSSSLTWSTGDTRNSITVNPVATTTYTATCSNGTTCQGDASITINVGSPSAPVISSNGTAVCAGSQVTLTASACDGNVIWSNGLTGTSIQVSPVAKTTYTAVCELGGTNCTSGNSNAVIIDVTSGPEAPTITCSTTRICVGESVTMTAIGCAGTVTWSNGETGESITVSPSETTVYTATCSLGTCVSPLSAPATMNVGLPIAPVVSCQNTLICQGSSTVIEAAGCTGTVIWSDGQQGAVITVSPTEVTNYSAVCDAGVCESVESNVVTVAISGQGVQAPTVSALMNTCPNTTVDLTTAVSSATTTQGGSFVFRTGASPNSPAVDNISAIATSGTFYVFEAAGNGCFSAGSQIDVAIIACETNVDCEINPATAFAGSDTTICLSTDSYQLAGSIGGAAQAGTWTTSGNGAFSNATDVTSNYTFSFDDVVNGSVVLTLTTNDPDNGGTCEAATSSFTININAEKVKPTISTNVSPNICLGDSVTLTADQDAAGYVWSTGDTTRSIVVKTPGDYTVKLVNASGCCSVSSEILSVKINSSIVAPTVNALASNTCPATTVDLSGEVLSTPTTDSGVFEFRLGESPMSDLITNTSAVGEGDYYVFERTPTGCYSSPSAIKVAIDNCEVNDGDADIAITIVGDKSDVTIGDEVVYTITVTNNGPSTATNVQIDNTLPRGIKIIGATPNLIQVDDVLKTTIASLANGESITYTYTGELTKAGIVSNIAEVVGLDQTDPVASNDFSQFDVECNSCQETCVAVALKADTLQNTDGTWNITFTSIIENCGNVDLTGVELLNDLSTMFTSPASFTIAQQPSVNTGSELAPNTGYDGVSDNNALLASSKLVAGRIDTVQWTVALVPNGTEGPYSTNAVAKGVGMTAFGIAQEVSDVSNDGSIIDKPSGSPTVVRLFKSPAIGLSLAISDTTKLADGTLDVLYKAIVKNNGSLPLNGVVVEDTLINTYMSPASFSVKAAPSINNATTSLVVNPDYNGSIDHKLTLGTSNLAVGAMDTICFTVNVDPATVKEFENQAYVQGTSTLTDNTNQTVTDVSNAGYNPDAPGNDPTMLIIGDDNTSSLQDACIGAALYVADSSRKADGSYDITYHAILRNCGNVNLKDIELCDTLANSFTDPSVAVVVGNVSLSSGSTLAIDSTFDGVTNTCLLNSATSSLPPSTVDTVKWTINLTLNSNNGPFRNNITVKGKTATDEEVSDVSNNGLDPNPQGEAPTVLNFNNLPQALIGLAKEVESVEKADDGMYEVVFNFNVKNYGIKEFERVQVQDNLAATFGDLVMIDSTKVIETSENFTASNMFTGKGQLIDMLVDSSSTLARNGSGFVRLWVKVDLSQTDTSAFENMALAIGYTTDSSIDDQSTEGTDPDPEADGTPENNSIPTRVDFGSIQDSTQVAFTPLGIGKSISDTVATVDGSYQVTYQVVVRNYGDSELTGISLTDSLTSVFADSTDFSLVGDVTTSGTGTLRPSTTFDGITDFELLADSSVLAVGASDTVTFKVKVRNNSSASQSYNNTIYGTAIDSASVMVSDQSQSGLNPDKDGDNNPGDDNEPTTLTLESADGTDTTPLALKIPGGISPNGDGENDNWVISGIRESDNVAVKIYNRWGHLVFESENYKADFPGANDGWKATSNRGIKIGGNESIVPDGTYFYSIQSDNTELWEGKPVYDFLTIAGGEKE